jgi:hypothetical protein
MMTMKIRLYHGAGPPTPGQPAATLVLGTGRDMAVRLPAEASRGAQFFLERVETSDQDLERALIETLTRESVPVMGAAASRRGGIRTHGEYRSAETYGTAAYWRAAIGRLPHDLGLEYDLDDYRAMLARVARPQIENFWGRAAALDS